VRFTVTTVCRGRVQRLGNGQYDTTLNKIFSCGTPSPPQKTTSRAVMLVWWLGGKIIRTLLCCVVNSS